MENLIRSFAIMVIALLSTTRVATAQWYSPDAAPSSVGSISVVLFDDAKDACWTNLRVVREYAEEKLKIEGYIVVADNSDYDFTVEVLAYRDMQGFCLGGFRVSINKLAFSDGIGGQHEIGFYSRSGAVNRDNFNNNVIAMISEMIAEM